MNKLNMESKDIVKDNLEYIKERFPEAVTEENGELRINPDSLIQSLSSVVIDDKKEKYELTWPGKRQSIVEGNTRTTKTLRPIIEKSVDFENTKNIYIEGDNLDALKILQESYLNKIKCIYIDPPYNTGNDLVYKDNFSRDKDEELLESGQVDELGNKLVTNSASNGRFHSDWLSMIYPRLKLARNLLSDDGMIFISIDDNELFNLKKVCDEIYGENNFVSCIINQSANSVYGSKATNKNKTYIKVKDYILVYKKGNQDLDLQPLYSPGRTYLHDSHDFVYENGRKISTTDWFKENYSDVFKKYDLSINKDSIQKLLDFNTDLRKEIINKLLDIQYRTVGSFDKNKLSADELRKISNGEVVNHEGQLLYAENENHTSIGTLRSLRESCQLINGEWIKCEILGDIWNTSSDYQNINAEGGIKFKNGKKPIAVVKNALKSINDKNAIVLDFFSGSATTAHAVMQLNSEDDGNRKFILVQIPEDCSNNTDVDNKLFSTICDLGEERIRRAAKKIKEETNADIDYGFRVYKIDESNMKDEFYMTPDKISQEQIRLFEDNIKEDRTPDDLITQVILNLGLKLDLPIEEKDMCGNKVYDVDDGELLACFDDNVSIDIIEEIAKINPRQVVFRDSSFATDQDKVNFEERLKRLSAGTKFNVL